MITLKQISIEFNTALNKMALLEKDLQSVPPNDPKRLEILKDMWKLSATTTYMSLLIKDRLDWLKNQNDIEVLSGDM